MSNNISSEFVLVLFPSCYKHWNYIENVFNEEFDVLDKRKIKLMNQEIFNFVHCLYKDELWIGNGSDDWKGLRFKIKSCFPKNEQKVELFYIKATIDEVQQLKIRIRKYCGCGNHSIHSVDEEDRVKEILVRYFK
jgi:hypothetical protein